MLDWEALKPERHRPLRRSEFEQLVDAGVFHDENVELLDGWLVTMSPQGHGHIWVVGELNQLLILQLQALSLLDRFTVRPQCSYPATEYSEPEPDIVVVPRQRFGEQLRGDGLLVIEVSGSSLRKDRSIKTRIYADSGVPEYWIVDLEGGAVEVYTEPRDGAYQTMVRVERGATLRPIELPGVAIAVDAILPAP